MASNQQKRNQNQISVFISYCRKDKKFKDSLENALSPLVRRELITLWCDEKIAPGDEWSKQIDNKLNSCDLILLLISTDFIDSDFCYAYEAKRAVERHKEGTAYVIPIIIRPTLLGDLIFSHLQSLPENLISISEQEQSEKAWEKIAAKIEIKADEINKYNVNIENIILSYHKDNEEEKNRLIEELSFLIESKKINIWPYEINTKIQNSSPIFRPFNKAKFIIVITSDELINSFTKNHKLNEKLSDKNIEIVPIILRPLTITENLLSSYYSLPTGGGAISEWSSNEVWSSIYYGISLLLDGKKQPVINESALKDFFFPKDFNDLKKWHLFPTLTDRSYVEPNFFDCICSSLKEDSHVVFIHGSARSGKSLILNKAMNLMTRTTTNNMYRCTLSDDKNNLLKNLELLKEEVVIVDDFEALSSIERQAILNHSYKKIMIGHDKILLILVGQIELNGPLSKMIRDLDKQGLYDHYKVDFSTYGSNQILQMILEIESRFNTKFEFNEKDEIARYSVNSIFIARSLCYEMLKNHVNDIHPLTISFGDGCMKIFKQLQKDKYFAFFEQLEETFTRDCNYKNELLSIIEILSKKYSKGLVSLRKLAVNSRDENFVSTVGTVEFCDYIKEHINEISFNYPGFFDYDEATRQIIICNVEFLFYLKNKRFASKRID